jgi:hypothetical protein
MSSLSRCSSDHPVVGSSSVYSVLAAISGPSSQRSKPAWALRSTGGGDWLTVAPARAAAASSHHGATSGGSR